MPAPSADGGADCIEPSLECVEVGPERFPSKYEPKISWVVIFSIASVYLRSLELVDLLAAMFGYEIVD